MSQRKLIPAGPILILLVIACVGGMRAVSGISPQGSERCPEVSIDTRDWQSTRSFEIGVELLHPPNYQRKLWEVRSPGYPTTLDLWRDGRLGHTVQLELMRADSVRPFTSSHNSRSLRCTMRTRSGDLPAFLERVAKTRVAGERDSFYLVRVRLPWSDNRAVVAYKGYSIDSAGYVEQIAVAQTLRLRELGASPK